MSKTNFIRNKSELIRRAEGHAAADRLNQGTYFTRFTHSIRERLSWYDDDTLVSRNHVGLCAVGCLATPLDRLDFLAHAPRRRAYNTLQREFGIPEALAECADRIFEGLSKRKAKKWPVQFARALPRRSITQADAREWKREHEDELAADDTTRARDALLAWLKDGTLA